MSRSRSVNLLVAVEIWILATIAFGEESLGPYLLSLKGREPGRLTGRLYFEPAKPEGEVKPLPGVSLLVLPSTPPLWAALAQLRQEYRTSGAEYRGVLAKFDRLIQDYRQRVEAEGGGELVRTSVVDAEGRFELLLPGGSWVVVVNHSVLTPLKQQPPSKPKPPPSSRPKGPSVLPEPPPPTKAREVSLWAYRVEVPAGGTVRVDLHDRNRWLVHLVRE